VRAAWWQERQDEVENGFLVEPQNQGRAWTSGSQVRSGDWRRLHQVRGVCGRSPENHRVTPLSHKTEAEDQAWLSGQN
jgi:squalene cyclase